MKTLKERFESKIEMIPESWCWIWTGATHKAGYGMVQLKNPRRVTTAHRVSWEIYKGAIPPGLHVLHRCDVYPCVNPEHLFLGTNEDNQKDMITKKRDKKFSKLSDEQISKIRQDDRPQPQIAKDFNVSQQHVSSIKNHKRRKRISV
jgi:hypothetical protein